MQVCGAVDANALSGIVAGSIPGKTTTARRRRSHLNCGIRDILVQWISMFEAWSERTLIVVTAPNLSLALVHAPGPSVSNCSGVALDKLRHSRLECATHRRAEPDESCPRFSIYGTSPSNDKILQVSIAHHPNAILLAAVSLRKLSPFITLCTKTLWPSSEFVAGANFKMKMWARIRRTRSVERKRRSLQSFEYMP